MDLPHALFTVYFRGWSETGEAIRARLWTHNVWYVAVDIKADSPQLMAALAFIHRERLRCNKFHMGRMTIVVRLQNLRGI
jgi:hypothetical protein